MEDSEKEVMINIKETVDISGQYIGPSHISNANKKSRGYTPPGDKAFAERMFTKSTYDTKEMQTLTDKALENAYNEISKKDNDNTDINVPINRSTTEDTHNETLNIIATVKEKRKVELNGTIERIIKYQNVAIIKYESNVHIQEILSVSSVMLDGAYMMTSIGDTAEVSEIVHNAKAVIDIAMDFTPGVSIAKDIITIYTGINPVTNETVGNIEMGIIIAGIIVSGAIKGAAKGVTKAVKIAKAAMDYKGAAANAARKIIEYLNKAENFIKSVTSNISEAAEAAPEAKKLLAKAADYTGDIVDKTAKSLRSSPGKATISRKLFDSENILNGTHKNAGIVPKEVAESMSGKTFKDFDHFREDFWKTVNSSKYSKQFDEISRTYMAKGKAPLVHESQIIGTKKKYELHHITPINKKGDVYDLSNICIVTPRFHKEVLTREYHYLAQ